MPAEDEHLDLAQERAQVESVEAELPVLEEQELEARVALAVLLSWLSCPRAASTVQESRMVRTMPPRSSLMPGE